MNTPRIALVAISVPDQVTDQELADRLWKVIRQAIEPDGSAQLWPDPATLEVVVRSEAEGTLS